MPYKDPEKQKQYQKAWSQRRRLDWVTQNGPCTDCCSWETLEVDHVDASQKVDHRVWTWSAARREAELSKCVVRCHNCHSAKTTHNFEHAVGSRNRSAKLHESDIGRIKQLRAAGMTYSDIATEYGILSPRTISRICRNLGWLHT